MNARAALIAVVAVVLIVPATSSAASSATIKGKLSSAKGVTVNGTASNGQVVSKTVGAGGKFSLKFKKGSAKGASLQLVSSAGRYLGPVVLMRKGKKAYTQLAGKSVDLGKIEVLKGYAIVAKGVKSKLVNLKKASTASKSGKPLGAGKLGIVGKKSTSKSLRAGLAAGGPGSGTGGGGQDQGGGTDSDHEQGEDPDRDGIANAFDADDNNNGILDNQDPFNSTESGGVFSTLFASFAGALNVNVGNASTEAIDALIKNNLNVIYYFDDGQFRGSAVNGASVNCFALGYCARGSGTAIISGVTESGPDLPRGQPWTSYSPDGSGFPGLERIASRGASVMSILPNATTTQITPGDSYQVLFDTSSGPVTLARTLPPYFVTTPAITNHDTGGGPQTVSYPITSDAPGTSQGNPLTMSSEQLTLTLFRPQRLAVPGAESGTFVDMGHLHYGAVIGTQTQEFGCRGNYSNLSSTLTEGAATDDPSTSLFSLTDSAGDAAPNPSSTLSFKLDLGACLRANGLPSAGQIVDLTVTATGDSRPGGVDRAAQNLTVKLPG